MWNLKVKKGFTFYKGSFSQTLPHSREASQQQLLEALIA